MYINVYKCDIVFIVCGYNNGKSVVNNIDIQ